VRDLAKEIPQSLDLLQPSSALAYSFRGCRNLGELHGNVRP